MSLHISAKKEDIANIVLMPGDPLRAKFIADNYLQNVKLVNQTRNCFYFTGTYKEKRITVGSSGMGCASIGIYSYELYADYDVDCIIRIGTCGAYTADANLLDLINVTAAASESTYAKFAWDIQEDAISHQGNVFSKINETANKIGCSINNSVIHSSDIFYRKSGNVPEIALKYQCTAVEMEAFALFANAKYTNKEAACILTVSDIIPTGANITAAEREKSLLPMIQLALETTLDLF
ncbi:MAG: purine-nucleoside phosphorylase [Bacteroidetes bacterium]|nr:purine-nucleoside phosphorylase [Bacteroidota bacterium]